MQHYQILSALLLYPEPELIDQMPEIREALAATPEFSTPLQPLLDYLASEDLITIQQNYVMTFDRTPSHSLHLF